MDFYGNINLKQNKMQQMVWEKEDQFPVAIVGRVVFKEQQLYMCVAINNTIPVWLPLANKIDFYIHDQSSASQTWTITHNLNSVNPILQIYDAAGLMVIPNTVVPVSNNEMSVTLGTAMAGTAVVLFGTLLPDSGIGLLEALSWPATIAGTSFDNTSQSTQQPPYGLFFNAAGTKMFVAARQPSPQNGFIEEYTLSTGNDLSTATYIQSFDVTSEERGPAGVFFKPDGLKMYVVGEIDNSINQYTLSSSFDVSTASFDSVSFPTVQSNPGGCFMNDDGTTLYIVGDNGAFMRQYQLSVPYDISSTGATSDFSITQDGQPEDIFFNPDGDKMFVVGSLSDSVYQYTLGTNFDITTAVYDNISYQFNQNNAPRGIFFSADGTKMYMSGTQTNNVYQYTVG